MAINRSRTLTSNGLVPVDEMLEFLQDLKGKNARIFVHASPGDRPGESDQYTFTVQEALSSYAPSLSRNFDQRASGAVEETR